MKIKIIGCGSAGNHISFAFSKYAKKITMTDTSEKFFLRSKKIYIQRYNKWNNKIDFKLEKNDKTFYDVILISSPPNTHFKLLKKNIDKANLFMIEKPLLQPSKLILDKFNNLIKSKKNKKILCGYNHRLFPSTKKFLELFRNKIKLVNSLTINFKETTSGFLKAHNWMKSIEESYLGSTKNGGGSLCEHSHGINLAQFFIPTLNDKDLINKKIKFSQNKKYDLSSELLFKKNNIYISVNQNFITSPVEKNIVAIGKNILIKLVYNHELSNDRIIFITNKKKKIFDFKKKRQDDFIYEADHIYELFRSKKNTTPIDSNIALNTMKIINKALKL